MIWRHYINKEKVNSIFKFQIVALTSAFIFFYQHIKHYYQEIVKYKYNKINAFVSSNFKTCGKEKTLYTKEPTCKMNTRNKKGTNGSFWMK